MRKLLLLTLILLCSSCGVFRKNNATSQKKKVLIIGAGISGLSAAKYLKKRNYNPILLEAQSKVGGRLKTNRSLGIAFDEGASWIHGPNRNPIKKLAKKSNMGTFLTQDENIKVYDIDGTEYSTKIISEEEDSYNNILRKIKGHKNKSFAKVFYKNYPQYQNQRLWIYMLSAFLEFDTGGDIYKLSSKYFYADEAFKGEDIIATNGYDNISNYLAKDLDIRLNTKVTSINYANDKIAVVTDNGEYSADIVLVTVPLGVLKKDIITFTPELPNNTLSAIEKLEMGTVNKFLLVWDKAFWDKNLQYVGYTPKEKGKFNYFLNIKNFTNANALMTFAFGDYSLKTEQMTDQAIIEEIMVHLKSIYGKDIPNPTKMLRTKWNENPYSYGSYSFITKGLKNNVFEVFETPINNKIFFAGEHTTIDYRGTVHGAYLSGIREAKKIAKQK